MAQDKYKRRNRTAAEMFPLVEAYQSGSVSRADFCAARQLPISALNYWQTKYRKAHGQLLVKKRNGFVELTPAAAVVSAPVPSGPGVVMELAFGTDQRLRFYGYPPADYLGQLLSMERC